jgi:sterol desaturase/sphingolipid hydroxylase (fatty acid hydroxylase superfamily)
LALIVGIGVLLVLLERKVPDRHLPNVPGWWRRVTALNAAQLGVVVLAGYTWDRWLSHASLFSVGALGLAPPTQGLFGYFIASFVYYWWHRARHEVDFLWLACHQLHHSPQRIEALTSFYKHPVELVANSLLSGLVSYGLLGLTPQGAVWVTFYSALAEYFYHLNVRTPRWVGLFVQRPEMHRIHHARGAHYGNFGDLPIWDMLFGTYRNPAKFEGPCGFEPELERQLGAMLTFRDVNGAQRRRPGRGQT